METVKIVLGINGHLYLSEKAMDMLGIPDELRGNPGTGDMDWLPRHNKELVRVVEELNPDVNRGNVDGVDKAAGYAWVEEVEKGRAFAILIDHSPALGAPGGDTDGREYIQYQDEISWMTL